MKNINFWLGLWSGKLASFILSFNGNKNDDRPGLLARKFDENFNHKAGKPEHVLLISGTNGKSSVTNIINAIYKKMGKKVGCNDAGNNTFAGQAWTLLKSNNIFNKPNVDALIMEADELFSRETFPDLNPKYLIITNLGRDSMFKNGNPEIPYNSLNDAIKMLPETTLFLNADDPLSCFLGENNKRIYYGLADFSVNKDNNTNVDFSVCPNCAGLVKYDYINYRHIGRFHCPDCGLKSPACDYECIEINDNEIKVKEKDGVYTYPIISKTIYNIYNETAIIAYFRYLNYSPEKISELLKDITLPSIREEKYEVNGIEIIRRAMKGQNAYAASSVLEAVKNAEGNKEVILMLDEIPDETGMETICWIWDTNYELLNDDKIKRIIVSGKRHLDHKLRLLTSNVNENKIINFEDDKDINANLLKQDIDKIFILYDVMALSRSRKVAEEILKELK